MVLVVVADVQRDLVQRAVVAVGFLGRRDKVVLLDPAAAEGMEANREEERHGEIGKSLRSQVEIDGCIETELNRKVQEDPSVEHMDFLQPGWPGDLKYGKEEQPKSLADCGITD